MQNHLADLPVGREFQFAIGAKWKRQMFKFVELVGLAEVIFRSGKTLCHVLGLIQFRDGVDLRTVIRRTVFQRAFAGFHAGDLQCLLDFHNVLSMPQDSKTDEGGSL